MNWNEIKNKALELVSKYSDEYKGRINDEIKEIEKQGANQYWTDAINKQEKWQENPSGLVLPFLFKLTPIDPITSGIKHNWVYQTEYPDIDSDFLPAAKKIIREYATEKYKHVCSVGNWNTYGPKSALQDAVRALGGDLKAVMDVTTKLPDEFDDLSWDDHLKLFDDQNSPDDKIRGEAKQEIAKYQQFYNYQRDNPRTVDIAYRLVGKIKSQGTHAGGLIIADRPIEDVVPLSYMGKAGSKNWTSQWTEGRNTQLSKFGLVKFDILGVKTLYYIWQAQNLIRKCHGIEIDWDDMDPTLDPPRAGWIIRGEQRDVISFNDEKSLKMCNDLLTESVFQIETDIQKGIIKDGRVKTFNDLVIYNALGRPGPMDAIPDYITNRDDIVQSWKNGLDERIVKILGDTYGIICYQEQLAMMWRELAGFTVPEAEAARKIIAKKWLDKLPQVEKQWKEGATKTIGEAAANDWWQKMYTFGRYAFNRSHALAYSIITFRCLFLKSHYPAQWWAAVMTECHSDKLSSYMGAAKRDGVSFGPLDVNNLTHEFSVDDNDCVIPGLKSIKKIGEKASAHFCSIKGPFTDLDQMISLTGKHKSTYERLIKLGGFDKLNPNRKGLWTWYQYEYCTGDESNNIRKEFNAKYVMPQEEIEAERQRQISAYKKEFPKKKLPKKLENWKPKPRELTINDIIPHCNNYTSAEMLYWEKELLGFYWSSPLSVYDCEGDRTLENAKKEERAIIEVVIEGISQKTSKKSNTKFYLLHVNDGVQKADIVVWADVFASIDRNILLPPAGIRLSVEYSAERKGFRIANGSGIIPLIKKGCSNKSPVKKTEEEDLLW